ALCVCDGDRSRAGDVRAVCQPRDWIGCAAETGGVRVRVPRGPACRADTLRHDDRADVYQWVRERQGLVESRADLLVRESRGVADGRLRLVEAAGILVRQEIDMTDLPVLSSADDGIGRIVLNRPDKRNALTHAMMTAILDALDGCSGDDGVGVVVVSAAGTSFCSGVDLADMQAVREQRGSFD